MDRERSRDEIVEILERLVEAIGWRVRTGDTYQVVLLPPLARPNPVRNRWPNEPEEGQE